MVRCSLPTFKTFLIDQWHQVQSDRGSFRLHHWGQIPAEVSLQWRMVCILLNLKILTLTNFDNLKYFSQSWPGGTSRVVQSFSTLATRGWSRLLLRTGWSGFSSERLGCTPSTIFVMTLFVCSGFMWDIAPEFNALLVFAEHRYMTNIHQVLDHYPACTWSSLTIV